MNSKWNFCDFSNLSNFSLFISSLIFDQATFFATVSRYVESYLFGVVVAKWSVGTHRQEGRPFTASSSKWKDNIISSIGDNLGNVHMLILLGTLLETLLENLLETLVWTQVRTLFEILLPIMIKNLDKNPVGNPVQNPVMNPGENPVGNPVANYDKNPVNNPIEDPCWSTR